MLKTNKPAGTLLPTQEIKVVMGIKDVGIKFTTYRQLKLEILKKLYFTHGVKL